MIGLKSKKNHWVIGTYEIANQINLIQNIFESSVSVSLNKHPLYENVYDYTDKSNFILCRLIYRPILLAYLSASSTHFFYIWHLGFLRDRNNEFKFLKNKNKKIVCLFVGNDIRSLKLTHEYGQKYGIDLWGSYDEKKEDLFYDNEKRKIAKSADKYADLIFSAPMDQMSYLNSKLFPWVYTYDKKKFNRRDDKFQNIEKIKICHAPTNPINKGTPLVRAAIKKLQAKGYVFEYIEAKNMPNEVLLEHLRSTHIVLNQFYAFSPGLFGVESMANHTAVLMSADSSIETTLPQDSKDAWMITRYWEVYDNLKYLLDNPEQIQYYADKGYDFAYKHYTYEAARESIQAVLKEQGII